MRRSPLLVAATLAFCVALSACASTGGVRTVPITDGDARVFSSRLDPVLKAARASVLGAGFTIDSVSKFDDDTWMIVSTKGIDLTSVGQIVRIVVQRTAVNETTVRVVSQRKAAMQLLARRNYSETIFAGIATNLR